MIKFKPITPFIGHGQALLLRVPFKNGFYIRETDVLPKTFETPHDAVKADDEFAQAIRFDLKTLVGEDVTEECAIAWLSDFAGNPDETVPEFVAKSSAWERFCEEYDRENPRWRGPDPDQQRQEWLDDQYRYELGRLTSMSGSQEIVSLRGMK